jgi:hypothetical protein
MKIKKWYLTLCTLPTKCIHTVFDILPVKQTEETRSKTLPGYRRYQYKYTFYGQKHISWHDRQLHTQNYLQLQDTNQIAINGLMWLINTELDPVGHLLALLGTNHILHVSRVRVKLYTCIAIKTTAENWGGLYILYGNGNRRTQLLVFLQSKPWL